MIDIHSHILYGVDDGPETIELSHALLRNAVQEGITEIVSTSHVLHPQYNCPSEAVLEQVQALQNWCKEENVPITIHTGHEVRIHEDLAALLDEKKVLPLGNSNYVLIELPSDTVPTYTKPLIIQLQERGYRPIIAHPERNRAIIENPRKLKDLVNHGALTQVTGGSLTGFFGKTVQKSALELIDLNLIHTYGSDVHHIERRPFYYDAGLSVLEKRKQGDLVEVLLENNERVLRNERLILFEPKKTKTKKWWQLF